MAENNDVIAELSGGESLRLHLSHEDGEQIGGVEFPNPWETTVGYIQDKRLDPHEDDVRHMETHREVRLSSPDDADTNDEVVLKRVVKMTGGGQVSLTFKKHHRGDEGDYFTLNPVGVKEIELLDNN